MPLRAPNDYGGLEAGPVDKDEHVYNPYEKRVDAIKSVVQSKYERFTSDTSRRAQEGLGQDAYDNLPYYDRWLEGLKINLTELGIVTDDEIAVRVAKLKAERG